MDRRNHERLERAFAIISRATTESGEPIRVVRIPTPVLTFDVTRPGDGTYEYFAAYEGWEDGSVAPPVMLGVWNSSYVNYVPTNDLVVVSRFWKPGRVREIKRRDEEAVAVLAALFPGRRIVQVYSENLKVTRGWATSHVSIDLDRTSTWRDSSPRPRACRFALPSGRRWLVRSAGSSETQSRARARNVPRCTHGTDRRDRSASGPTHPAPASIGRERALRARAPGGQSA